MLFNSIDFLIFFPIVLFIYFILPAKIRYLWLLVASYYFYMCWNPMYLILIVLSTVITYLCGIVVGRLREKENAIEDNVKKQMKVVIAISFMVNIGLLIYFKYTNFLMDSVNAGLAYLNMEELPRFDILLPVGISFYTFQALGYTVDVYRGDVKAEKNLFQYALFVSFFPQLVAGPIERSQNLLGQIREEASHKLWDYQKITSGLITMLWGFFMKTVIADRAAILVDTVFSGYESYQMVGLAMGAVTFAIQIYCDFAGYSAIAIGAAKVLGFELMENFNAPYFADSIVDFWRRWHISLSTWFRDYLYIPLGGNRCSKVKKYRNILITFGISGLWHGAGWNYIVWGLLHGIYQILEKEFAPLVQKINRILHTRTESFGYRFCKALFTFALVDFAWIFFRADSMHQAVHYIQRLFSYHDWWSLFNQSIYQLGLDVMEMHILLFGILLLLAVDLIQYVKGEGIADFLEKQWIVFRWGVLLVLLFTCVVFGCYGPGFNSAQFIYFQF
ncbi:MAG: MBOAT family protein [Lachnospiraceae bacterium]|nr:MBOAT family protein [Lachnospiraceae bacterium]